MHVCACVLVFAAPTGRTNSECNAAAGAEALPEAARCMDGTCVGNVYLECEANLTDCPTDVVLSDGKPRDLRLTFATSR